MSKQKVSSIAIIAVLVLCFLFIPLLTMCRSNQASSILTPEEDASTLYSNAVSQLSETQNIQLLVDTYEITETKENIFRTSKQQNLTYLNCNSSNWQLSATETVKVGNHAFQTSTMYAEDTLYYSIDGSNFAGTCDESALSSQYPPAVILDPNAYQEINGLQVGKSTLIRFSSPSYPECWTSIDAAELQDACGSTWLDKNGNLVKSTYNIFYTKENVNVYKSVTVRIVDLSPYPISVPVDTGDYVYLNDPTLPMQLEIACGHLLQAQKIYADHTDTITCEIFGDTRLQNIAIRIDNNNSNPFLQMITTVELSNSSREGEILSSKQVQRYENGSYTVSTAASPEVIAEGASSQEFLPVFQEVLIGTILLPRYVQDVKSTSTDTTYRVEFTANDEFARKIISDAYTTLYNEPQLQDELPAQLHVDNVLCYLELSKESGLPTKSGIHLIGTYYVSELTYQLIFEADQTFLMP